MHADVQKRASRTLIAYSGAGYKYGTADAGIAAPKLSVHTPSYLSCQQGIETRLTFLLGAIAQTTAPLTNLVNTQLGADEEDELGEYEPSETVVRHTADHYRIILMSMMELMPLAQSVNDLQRAANQHRENGLLGVLGKQSPKDFFAALKPGRKVNRQDMAEFWQLLQHQLQQNTSSEALRQFYLSEEMTNTLIGLHLFIASSTDKQRIRQATAVVELLHQLTVIVHQILPDRHKWPLPKDQMHQWLSMQQWVPGNRKSAEALFATLDPLVIDTAQTLAKDDVIATCSTSEADQQTNAEIVTAQQGMRQSGSRLSLLGLGDRSGPADVVLAFLGRTPQTAKRNITEDRLFDARPVQSEQLTEARRINAAKRQAAYDRSVQQAAVQAHAQNTKIQAHIDAAVHKTAVAEAQQHVSGLLSAAKTVLKPHARAKVDWDFHVPGFAIDITVIAGFASIGLASIGTFLQFWFVPAALISLAAGLVAGKFFYESAQNCTHTSALSDLMTQYGSAVTQVAKQNHAELCEQAVALNAGQRGLSERGMDLAWTLCNQQKYVKQTGIYAGPNAKLYQPSHENTAVKAAKASSLISRSMLLQRRAGRKAMKKAMKVVNKDRKVRRRAQHVAAHHSSRPIITS